jgi:hypothetical protein
MFSKYVCSHISKKLCLHTHKKKYFTFVGTYVHTYVQRIFVL